MAAQISMAQSPAMDFTMNDCNGNMHNLFSELDQNRVIILEFFMLNCTPCITAGHEVEPLYNQLNSQYNNHLSFYHFGYDDTYTCQQISDWVTTNGFNSTPFDSGAYQAAYYGGFGMPTIVVVAGSNHGVIYSSVGYTLGDSSFIHTSVINYFAAHPTGINPITNELEFGITISSEHGVFHVFSNAEITKVEVISIEGKILKTFEGPDSNSEISFAGLANGLYIIKAYHHDIFSTKKAMLIY